MVANLYSVHFDPKLWDNPHKFDPNRFLDAEGKVHRKDKIVPFSIGRCMTPLYTVCLSPPLSPSLSITLCHVYSICLLLSPTRSCFLSLTHPLSHSLSLFHSCSFTKAYILSVSFTLSHSLLLSFSHILSLSLTHTLSPCAVYTSRSRGIAPTMRSPYRLAIKLLHSSTALTELFLLPRISYR